MGYRRVDPDDTPTVNPDDGGNQGDALTDELRQEVSSDDASMFGYLRELRREESIPPLFVFGESKPIRSDEVSRHLTDDVFYYIGIYENNKMFGFPYRDWLEMPRWMIDLHKTFERIEREWEYHNIKKNTRKKH